jgi:hypothetical protein
MKKILKFSAFVLVASLILGLAGCSDGGGSSGGGGGGGSGGGGGEDDIFKENVSGKLLTTNLGAEDLVLFYDSVRSANFIGGLPANANRFLIKLPDSNKMYVIYAIKYSDFKGKSSTEIQNIKVFDSTLVYSDPVNETTCRIGDPRLAGDGEFKFQNQTKYFIEVGDGSPNDEDRFFVMRPNAEDSIFVMSKSDGYKLCFTLNLPMKKNGKMLGVQRRFIEEWSDIFNPGKGRVENVVISNAAVTDAAPSYREGYLRIINNSGRGYRVRNGSEIINSTLERSAISNGEEMVWELSGDDASPGKSYEQFKLEAAQTANNLPISKFHIQNGYKYTLTLNSNSTYTMSLGTPLNPEEEEITW